MGPHIWYSQKEPIAAFKANTRNDRSAWFVGDSDLEKEAIRVMKEFAWEHDMPLSGKLFNRIRSRIV